jgi:hypothetical protein
VIDIGHGTFTVDNNGVCTSACWESSLCSSFSWESLIGDYDVNRANGDTYFVYPARDNSLTYFGASRVRSVNGNKIYFEPFSPLSDHARIRGLRAIDFLGKKWGMGTHRYLNDSQEERFVALIGGTGLGQGWTQCH